MDVSSLQALYAEICRAPRVLTEADRSLLPRLYGALRDFLWLKARRLVRDSVDTPLFVSYQSDATSHLLQSHLYRRGVRVPRRSTRPCVGGAFGRARLHQGAVLFRPREGGIPGASAAGIIMGKPCSHGFSAACELQPMLRQWNHQRILVDHFTFDRAVCTPMVSKLHACVEQLYAHFLSLKT